MTLAGALRQHAVHFVVLGVPIVVIGALYVWQEVVPRLLRGRARRRSTSERRADGGNG